MGRYVNSGAKVGIPDQSQTLVCGRIYPRFNQTKFVYSCDSNECWPNRVLIDTPGSYTFTVPSGATCARAVLVGGGGKFGCKPGTTSIFGGAGGAYAEKFFSATAGTSMSIVVGAQQQSTSLSYPTNSLTVTAGGATFCTAGTASGGDINSTGGAAGCAFSSCLCATCYGTTCVACCGYCMVIGCMPASTDGGIQQCCALHIPGGGSAGSFIFPNGGPGGTVYDNGSGYTSVGGSGGGGGIGTLLRCSWTGSFCNCVCSNSESWCINTPGSASGGGGTKYAPCLSDMCTTSSFDGICTGVHFFGGSGHLGGHDKQEGLPDYYYSFQVPCCNCSFYYDYIPATRDPSKYPWHDIYDINGTGSAGKVMSPSNIASGSDCPAVWGRSSAEMGTINQDAGEGAGAGGVYYNFCDPGYFNLSATPSFIDWVSICCLGVTNRIDEARTLRQKWFPNVLGCAGTLGGSGGVSICDHATMAGPGGGAGGFKRFVVCICHGGVFNCCNQTLNTPLTFPPACLDYLISNAGPGMAIIYWK